MKIILEESQRLSAAREVHRMARSGSNQRADGDISLTDLPDLTPPENQYPHAPGFIKRVSSRDSGVALLVAKSSKMSLLKRAQSQRPSNADIAMFSLPPRGSVVKRSSTNRNLFAAIDEGSNLSENQQERHVGKAGDWQNSLKKLLAEGRDQLSPAASLSPEVDGENSSQQPDLPDSQDR
jgi:hypothetical protein